MPKLEVKKLNNNKVKSSPIYQLINDFLEYLEIEKNRSPLTIKNYHFYLCKFLEWASNQGYELNSPEQITQPLIRSFRRYLSRQRTNKGEFLSPNTQAYYLISIRAFLKYLAKQDIKSLAPEKIELPKLREREISFLEGEDLENFLNAPLKVEQNELTKLRDKAILELLFSTGLRVSELTNLKIEDINLEKDEFHVKGKGGRVRVVFLSNQAKYWLKKYLDQRKDLSPALFVRTDKAGENNILKGLTPRSVQRLVKKYAKVAGLTKRVTPHSLRHTFGTDLLRSGADIRSIQALLGHKNISTTQIYTHITDTHLKKIYKTFHDKQRKSPYSSMDRTKDS